MLDRDQSRHPGLVPQAQFSERPDQPVCFAEDPIPARSSSDVGSELDQFTERDGPPVVPPLEPGDRLMAEGVGELGLVGEQGDLGADQLRLGEELDEFGPAEGSADVDQRSVGLGDQTGTEQGLGPVHADDAPFEIRQCVLTGRHQLQGSRKVAGQELVPAEIVRGIEHQFGRSRLQRQSEGKCAIVLGLGEVSEQAVKLAAVEQHLRPVHRWRVLQEVHRVVELDEGVGQLPLADQHRAALRVHQDADVVVSAGFGDRKRRRPAPGSRGRGPQAHGSRRPG